ncbi:TerB family tellurite resistance protein [Hymenobacter sp. BT186]|uniref:TerB family tellurite resistance protein n=1 Tax=Hymenobacter telluris TaxID=2816474 RepID=A0A939EYE7_9BACT|nr:TerB family tellurite resistance protein [Hymenobacter telluris]MBO0359494.1 TerB family tellurite resistance protein [Hymenobacter telluris]MBW3375520.1 TerB family tellurite resistance protein [Hymenobacter norwichensis]
MNDTQLLQNYSEQEKTAYLSVIASLASADREASEAEIEFLQQLAQQAGLSGGAAQQVVSAAKDSTNQSVQANLDALRGSDLRFSLVTDLISFARADGSYANDEEAMVNKISAYLGINQQQTQALEQVVDQASKVPHDASDPAKQGFLGGITDKLSSVGIPKGALMAGLLGVVAPMVISKVMGGRSQGMGGGMMGGGTMGGLLGGAMGGNSMGGLLGGLLGGGLLSSVLGGGGQSAGNYPQQGSHVGSGGLGSLMSVLGGLGGQPNSAPRSAGGGGLGSLLGGGGSMGGLLGGLLGGR